MTTKQTKLAVLFPGIGYTCDRPLLYYAGRMLQRLDYQVVPLTYGGFPPNIKGDPLKMLEAFFSALDQTEDQLKPLNFNAYDDILFIGKSVGTRVALQYARDENLNARFALLTPVEQTFDQFPSTDQLDAIVFHGTNDPWAKTETIITACQERNLPLYIFADANHSLETGDVDTDIQNLQQVMDQLRRFAEGQPSSL